MAKEFAYCSSGCTRPQFEKQLEAINQKYPNALIIKEVYSETMADRRELKKLLPQLEKDDTLILYSMERLSRDPEQLVEYYMQMIETGIKLVFICQPYMDTDVYLSAFENVFFHTSTQKGAMIKKGIRHLLTLQVVRILEKNREDLQKHRGQMKKSYAQARLEGGQKPKGKGKRYESRKSFMVKELIKKYNQTFDGSMNDIQTMDQIHNDMGTISRNTFYKYKKEMMEDMQRGE